MKKVLTIAGLLLALTAHAQTVTGNYSKEVTDHTKDGAKYTSVTKFKSGRIQVATERITIDTAVYTVIKHGSIDQADEGYFTETLMAVTTTKKGDYKVYDIVLLLKPNKTIAEVIVKKTKATSVSYVLN